MQNQYIPADFTNAYGAYGYVNLQPPHTNTTHTHTQQQHSGWQAYNNRHGNMTGGPTQPHHTHFQPPPPTTPPPPFTPRPPSYAPPTTTPPAAQYSSGIPPPPPPQQPPPGEHALFPTPPSMPWQPQHTTRDPAAPTATPPTAPLAPVPPTAAGAGSALQVAEGQQLGDVISRVQVAVDGCRTKSTDARWAVVAFGGAVNGFSNQDSDVDLSLLPVSVMPGKSRVMSLLHTLASRLQQRNFSQVVKVLHARIPIIRCTDTATGRSVDINVNNALGVRNSELLAEYARYDPRIAALGKLVKRWAHEEGLVGTRDGYLSSYAWVLMTIFYLQTNGTADTQPVAPNLQADGSALIKGDYVTCYGETYDCRFATAVHAAAVAEGSGKQKNTADLPELLHGFFSFYTVFDWDKNAVSMRLAQPNASGVCVVGKHQMRTMDHKAKQGWVVEDPFETNRNLAKCCTLEAREVMTDKLRWCANLGRSEVSMLAHLLANPTHSTDVHHVFARVFMQRIDTAHSIQTDLAVAGVLGAVLHYPKFAPNGRSRFDSCFLEFTSRAQCRSFVAFNDKARLSRNVRGTAQAIWDVHSMHRETARHVMGSYAPGFVQARVSSPPTPIDCGL